MVLSDSRKRAWLDDALNYSEQNLGSPISKDFAYRLAHECTKRRDLELGRRVQSLITQNKLDSVSVLADHLIRLFGSCGSLDEAYQAFLKVPKPSQYTWNAIIEAHVKHGKCKVALRLYDDMCQKGGKPNLFTFPTVLKACGNVGAIEKGRLLHKQIVQWGLQSDLVVGNTLVDMYAKCGSLEEARRVFSQLPNRDAVTWSAMIAGCTQHGECRLALEYFESMQCTGIKPDKFTCCSILKACGSIGAIEQGKYIHKQFIDSGLQSDNFLEITLIDMYANCGYMEESTRVFNNLSNQDIISWGAIIAGYAQFGKPGLAFHCFEDMQRSGIKPDEITYNGLLTALSRAGLVEEGLLFFKSTISRPNVVHVTCVVDLLGRAGFFKEIEDLIEYNIQFDIPLWKSLLSTCRMHGNIELGRRCHNEIVDLDRRCPAAYCLMSDIYAG